MLAEDRACHRFHFCVRHHTHTQANILHDVTAKHSLKTQNCETPLSVCCKMMYAVQKPSEHVTHTHANTQTLPAVRLPNNPTPANTLPRGSWELINKAEISEIDCGTPKTTARNRFRCLNISGCAFPRNGSVLGFSQPFTYPPEAYVAWNNYFSWAVPVVQERKSCALTKDSPS